MIIFILELATLTMFTCELLLPTVLLVLHHMSAIIQFWPVAGQTTNKYEQTRIFVVPFHKDSNNIQEQNSLYHVNFKFMWCIRLSFKPARYLFNTSYESTLTIPICTLRIEQIDKCSRKNAQNIIICIAMRHAI